MLQGFCKIGSGRKWSKEWTVSGNYPICNFLKINFWNSGHLMDLYQTQHSFCVLLCLAIRCWAVIHSLPGRILLLRWTFLCWSTGYIQRQAGIWFLMSMWKCQCTRRDMNGSVKYAPRGKSLLQSFKRYWSASPISGICLEVMSFKAKSIFWTQYMHVL